jgi:hypothetical protein
MTEILFARQTDVATLQAQVAALQASILSSTVQGTTTNDNAPAGFIGEFISSTVLIGSAVSLTTSTPANVTSISLTAGDWDVRGTVAFSAGASTTYSQIVGALSSASATLPTNAGLGLTTLFNNPFTTGTAQVISVGPARFSLAATTTIYLVTQAGFGVSTLAAYGFLGARRVR